MTALAPMQDVTDLAFMKLLGTTGKPDYFFTEYFRVHAASTPESHILDSIQYHNTGRPVFAQLIGEDIPHLVRTAKELAYYPIAGIDLNMGCPAPKVYKKNVGGGLLRDPLKVEKIFDALKSNATPRFTVKMRIGFDSLEHYDEILQLVEKYEVDCLSVHGRTVKQMYRGEPDYAAIKHAKQSVGCPVFANGNIFSADKAKSVLEFTGCDGVMIGRSAIRNPWIFKQVREFLETGSVTYPVFADLFAYIEGLWKNTDRSGVPEKNRLNRMKKFLAFIGQAVDPKGAFLHRIRRVNTQTEFFDICHEFLLEGDNAQKAFVGDPYETVVARPNHEGPVTCSL